MSNANQGFKLPAAVGELAPDAMDAAWRVAGVQFVKLAREPLVAALSRQLGPGDEALRGRIAAFLQTELGTAMLAALLSAGLSAMPNLPILPGQDVTAKLARELRVKAMADAGDVVADLLMEPLRQTIAMYIQHAGTAHALHDSPSREPAPSLDARNVVDLPAAAVTHTVEVG